MYTNVPGGSCIIDLSVCGASQGMDTPMEEQRQPKQVTANSYMNTRTLLLSDDTLLNS